VGGDGRIDKLPQMRFQHRKRAYFIRVHQPAVSDDIGSHNGGELR
jgi:hypothetical protein